VLSGLADREGKVGYANKNSFGDKR
jgi:hypothetical protein